MSEVKLVVSKREVSSKGALNRLRNDSYVPGIYYSKKDDPIPISTEYNNLLPLVYTAETHVINLEIDKADPVRCIMKNVQFDPLTDRIIHFDLLGLTAGQTLQLEVPVVLTGSAIGVKEGGVLQQSMHKINVECLPRHIPDQIEVDITDLKFGDSIQVSQLEQENIKILNPEDVIIVSIIAPRGIEEEVAEAEGEELEDEMQEPEVIGKGKTEDEEENKED
jgi:large subunit ribosomal protein L25